jgi:HD-GYP domain-containing protein (c-di-GMP phosphodiesterase class II)
MRRIGVQYSQPGMVLSQDVYDSYGNMVMSQGTRLTFDNSSTLSRMGSGEIFIQDRRVDDVPVTSIMPARLQGEATRQLRAFLDETARVVIESTSGRMTTVTNIEKVIYSMVSHLFPAYFGEVNASGCHSLKDYNYVHPVQVASMCLIMGRKMGLKEDELQRLGVISMLQNVGYVALEPGMMDEPAAFSPIEMHEVKQHPQYGLQILRDYTHLPAEIIEGVYQHHERWDGNGYPRGLKGKDICLEARVIALADTYYALVSRRPHRQANLPNEAIEFIMAYSGELFDPEIVQLFTKIVPLFPTGVMVKLNTGESGIITDAKPGLIGRPVVRICYDKRFQALSDPIDIDLSDSEHQHRLVAEVIDY